MLVQTSMKRRRLGGSDLEITCVGIGTAPIGSFPGVWSVNWGWQEEVDSVRAIHAAVDGGVNWVDTAPFYGWGRAEEVVGRALERRDEIFVFSKCGTFRHDDGSDFEDHRARAIRRDLDASLKRLRRDHIDLLQLHDPDPETPIEESWATIQQLILEGKVRYGGLSNHPPDLVARALTIGPLVSLQFQYSALHRDEEERSLPFAASHGLGCIVWSPLASGFLTDGFDLDRLEEGDFRRRHPFAALDATPVRQELHREGDGSVTRGALRFVLRHPAVTGAIVGIRNEREGRDLARYTELAAG